MLSLEKDSLKGIHLVFFMDFFCHKMGGTAHD